MLSRLLLGATAAGIIPLSMAWIGDTVPYEQHQTTLAHFLGGQILGVIGGQFIGGVFTDTLGWRWAFGFLAIVFLEGTLVFGALAFVPSYLHERFGLTLTMAGALMACFGAGGLSCISAARYFVRRFREVGLATLGGLLIASAWGILALVASWPWAIPASYLVGLGFYMLHNTLQTNATQMAPEVRGTAVSLFASSFFLGQSLGVVAAALVLERHGSVFLFILSAALIPVVSSAFARLLARHHRPATPITVGKA